MAFVGRRLPLTQARPLNPAASVERPTKGAVSQLICSRTAR